MEVSQRMKVQVKSSRNPCSLEKVGIMDLKEAKTNTGGLVEWKEKIARCPGTSKVLM